MSPRALVMKQALRWVSVAALVAAVAACGDRPAVTGSEITPPPVPGGQPMVLGGWEVAVDSAGNVDLNSTGTPNASTASNGISAAVYGTQGVNVRVYTSKATIVTQGNTKTWTLPVGLRNLLGYPIGSNQAGASPADTMGLYLAVYSMPVVTSTSGSCASPCTVSLTGYDGTGNFTSTAQPYLYWHERLAAAQPVAGLDTVSARRSFVFSSPAAVTDFRFYVIVAAAWPPPAQTFWSVFYNAATDSLPETNAKPMWKKTFQLFSQASDSWSSKNGGQLILTAKNFADILLYRGDSIAPAMPAYIEGRLHVTTRGPSQSETVLLLQDGVTTAALGIQPKKIGFVQPPSFSYPNYAVGWSLITNSPTYALDATKDHTYRLRKFGTDSVTVEVDGVRRLGTAYSKLPGVGVYMPADASAGFGASSGTGNSTTTVWYVTYGFGQSQP